MGDVERALNRVYQQIDRTAEEHHQNYVELEKAVTALLGAGKTEVQARQDPEVAALLSNRSTLQQKTTDLAIKKWDLLRQLQSQK